MTNNISFIVHSWMLTSLELKGNELIAYAIIYKYSDIKGQKFVPKYSILVFTDGKLTSLY